MGHMGDGWDVAYAVLYLASDEAKYVTGTEILVDGGLCVGRCFGSQPRAKISMTSIRPPQQGHGRGNTQG